MLTRLNERHVRSVEELRADLLALKVGEVDALAHVSDPMVTGQTKLIVDTAKAKKLLTISLERSFVSEGGLASYGVNNFAVGRQSAKFVYRVLSGTSPADLSVERVDRFELGDLSEEEPTSVLTWLLVKSRIKYRGRDLRVRRAATA